MRIHHLLLLLLLSTTIPLPGQSIGDSSMVRWSGDARALEFMATYPELDRVIEGYRVQIHLGSKTDAVKVRQTFLQRHPEVPAYLSYLAPNFRIRVGDLRDRVEAERLRQELRAEFPGCYVVQDQIEPPALPKAEIPSAP